MKCAWELRVLLVHPAMYKPPQQAFLLTSQEVTLLSKTRNQLYVCEAKLAVTDSVHIGDSLGEGDTAGVREGKWAWVAGDAGEARRALLHISHHRGFVYHSEARVVGKLKLALGDGPVGRPRFPEWLVMVTALGSYARG